MALFAVMAFSASAVDIGSTADLLKYTGGGSYIDENGETQTVTETETVATTETFYITNDFDLTATATITLSGNYTIRSKSGGKYTITRTNGDFPMFTYTANFYIQNIIIDGNNVEGTADGGALYGATSGKSLYISGDTTFKNLRAKNGGAICVIDNAWTYIRFKYNNTFENCYASGNGGAIWSSGYVALEDGSHNVSFINNSAAGNGGAIHIASTSSSDSRGLKLMNGLFQGNSAANGGAVYYGLTGTTKTAIQKVTFLENKATGKGGAIYNSGVLTITSATISGSEPVDGKKTTYEATQGAGIFNAGTLTLGTRDETFDATAAEDSAFAVKFHYNYASNEGGAIYTEKKVTVNDDVLMQGNYGKNGGGGFAIKGFSTGSVIYGAKIVGNRTGNNGGGVYLNQADLTIEGAYITENYAGNGGGGIALRLDGWGAPVLNLNDAIISNNEGNNYGGGIFLTSHYSTSAGVAKAYSLLKMNGGTITGNRTNNGAGGGIYALGSVIEMKGGEISDNTANTYGGGIYIANRTQSSVDFPGELILMGGTISENTAKTDGAAIYVADKSKAYLLGGTITGHNNTANTIGMAETAIGMYLGTTTSYTAHRGEVSYTSTTPLAVYGNDTALPTAAVLSNAPVAGSVITLSDNGGDGYALDATGVTPDLGEFRLLGAEDGYLATLADGKIVWPTDTMQVVMQGDIGTEFNFRFTTVALRDAAKRAELKAYFHGQEIDFTAAVSLIPREIMDPIVFKNGDEELGTYTFAYYMNRLIAEGQQTELANAILNYGSAAQAYTGYTDNGLANPNYANGLAAPEDGGPLGAKVRNVSLIGEAPSTATFYSAIVSLDSKVAIKVFINDWSESASVTVKVGEETKAYSIKESASYAVLTIEGISAAELSNTYTVVMTDASGSSQLEYNLLAYLIEMEKDTNPYIVNLTRALYAYAVAAKPVA